MSSAKRSKLDPVKEVAENLILSTAKDWDRFEIWEQVSDAHSHNHHDFMDLDSFVEDVYTAIQDAKIIVKFGR